MTMSSSGAVTDMTDTVLVPPDKKMVMPDYLDMLPYLSYWLCAVKKRHRSSTPTISQRKGNYLWGVSKREDLFSKAL